MLNHSYCPLLSLQVLQFSRSANRATLDWTEICRNRGWTALDKDYPQLLPVKGCCEAVIRGGSQMLLMASWQILRTGARSPDHRGPPTPSIIAHHKTLLKTSSGVCSMFARCCRYFISNNSTMHFSFQGSCLCSSSVKNIGKVIYCYGDLLPRHNGLLSQSKSSESGTAKSSSKDLIVAQLGVWVLGLLAL